MFFNGYLLRNSNNNSLIDGEREIILVLAGSFGSFEIQPHP